MHFSKMFSVTPKWGVNDSTVMPMSFRKINLRESIYVVLTEQTKNKPDKNFNYTYVTARNARQRKWRRQIDVIVNFRNVIGKPVWQRRLASRRRLNGVRLLFQAPTLNQQPPDDEDQTQQDARRHRYDQVQVELFLVFCKPK